MNGDRRIVTAEMATMTPQQRSEVIGVATVRSWDEVPEPFQLAFWRRPARSQRSAGGATEKLRTAGFRLPVVSWNSSS